MTNLKTTCKEGGNHCKRRTSKIDFFINSLHKIFILFINLSTSTASSDLDGYGYPLIQTTSHTIPYRIPNTYIPGGVYTGGLVTWQECVSACMPPCVAADFDREEQSCWLHYGMSKCYVPAYSRVDIDHYRTTHCPHPITTTAARSPEGSFLTYHTSRSSPIFSIPDPLALLYPHPFSTFSPSVNYLISRGPEAPVTCGRPARSPSGGRIIGGQESRPGSWPWQVALRNKNARSSRCAGTFIDRYWVLTTAHCVDQDLVASNWLVLSGAHDLLSIETSRVAHSVEQIILHNDFNLDTFDSDIALLKLNTPVVWGQWVSPICLPERGQKFRGGTQCVVAGWGVAANGRRTLKQAALPVVAMETCKRKDWLGSEFTLTSNMLCAGYEHGGIDTCQGDSGGPLVCYIDDRWIQAGVTSFGRGCGLPHKPGVYTNVSQFIDWINSIVNRYA